ncbi:MAG: fumarate hydratase C-terminal domain-containing protein [Victivallales bacterium]|nr:fumarate hydratase C-terminal domain-containing protein [Victivallales bacterium]
MKFNLPFTEEDVRLLKLGDAVEITGTIFTARDAAHQYLVSHPAPEQPSPDLTNAVIYHCGPVIVRDADGKWRVTAAGPTTSSREEPYEATLIERFGLKAIIGKGGMGPKTAEACKKFGCVYLHAVGGAAQILAATVINIPNVYYYDQFGAPEAIWQFEVKDFPAVVTMDANGNSRHADVKQHSQSVLETLFN